MISPQCASLGVFYLRRDGDWPVVLWGGGTDVSFCRLPVGRAGHARSCTCLYLLSVSHIIAHLIVVPAPPGNEFTPISL